MYSSHVISSQAHFGTPHVPSSGSLCICIHNTVKWSVVWQWTIWQC